jgi:quercetin dioxygenase-like cupin family protein
VLRGDDVEVTRLHLRQEQQKPAYTPSDEALLYCVSGKMSVHCEDEDYALPAGSLMHLPAQTRHAIRGIEEGVVLIVNVSRRNPRQTQAATTAVDEEADEVQAASEDSFPASDPPSWTPVTSP